VLNGKLYVIEKETNQIIKEREASKDDLQVEIPITTLPVDEEPIEVIDISEANHSPKSDDEKQADDAINEAIKMMGEESSTLTKKARKPRKNANPSI
jgi:hypothetical protein